MVPISALNLCGADLQASVDRTLVLRAAQCGHTAIPAMADGSGACAGVCGIRGARPAVAAAHGAAEWARPAASRALRPCAYLPGARDRRREEPRKALRRPRVGWGRPGGAPQSHWGGTGRWTPSPWPFMGLSTCVSAYRPYMEKCEICRDVISGSRYTGESSW